MTLGLTSWWRARTLREQRLLLLMLALFALVLGWLLVIRPLGDALDAAQRRHAAAVVALADARVRAEGARRLRSERRDAPPLPVDGLLGRTATEAGFAGARIAADGPARASVAIDAARPQAFFAWVRLLERRGLIVDTLRARANDDRTLAIEAAFRARSG